MNIPTISAENKGQPLSTSDVPSTERTSGVSATMDIVSKATLANMFGKMPGGSHHANEDSLYEEKQTILHAPFFDENFPIENQLFTYRGEEYVKVMLDIPFGGKEKPCLVAYPRGFSRSQNKHVIIEISDEKTTWVKKEIFHHKKLQALFPNI